MRGMFPPSDALPNLHHFHARPVSISPYLRVEWHPFQMHVVILNRGCTLSGASQREVQEPPTWTWVRRDTGFLAFLFPRSLGSGVYDEINGGTIKTGAHLFELYLHQISTDLDEIWCMRKQNTVPKPKPMGTGFGTVFCLRVHQISSKSVEIWWRYSPNRCAPIFVVLH